MGNTAVNTIKLLVIEEQELYHEVYRSVLPSSSIELLDISPSTDLKAMKDSLATLHPDVLLLSTKRLEKSFVGELEQIRSDNPRLGIVLLLVFYNSRDIELLRKLALAGKSGVALFLKQSLDLADQLQSIIIAVNRGQVILDPLLTNFLLTVKTECPFLKQLTTREREILGLVAKGHTNNAIAGLLYIDLKTVEHHINSMYSKLKSEADFNQRHPRVSAARLYLEATGELSPATAS